MQLDGEMAYEGLRDRILPGDVIAFSGTGFPSETVKLATRSVVSHVGIIVRVDRAAEGTFPIVMEASPIEGFSGVGIRDLGDRILHHPGNIWWLPLDLEQRRRLDQAALVKFLWEQDGKPYDTVQAINSALDFRCEVSGLAQLTANEENFDQLFCSELVIGGLKAGGLLAGVNASELTPADLCQLAIYAPQYYGLKIIDTHLEIASYNSVPISQAEQFH